MGLLHVKQSVAEPFEVNRPQERGKSFSGPAADRDEIWCQYYSKGKGPVKTKTPWKISFGRNSRPLESKKTIVKPFP